MQSIVAQDNSFVCLPESCVVHSGVLEPNINDRGKPKLLWFGRIWELRELLVTTGQEVELTSLSHIGELEGMDAAGLAEIIEVPTSPGYVGGPGTSVPAETRSGDSEGSGDEGVDIPLPPPILRDVPGKKIKEKQDIEELFLAEKEDLARGHQRAFVRMIALCRGNLVRWRNSFAVLRRFEGCMIKGVVVFMHGSAGMTGVNLRYARMMAGAGYLVIAPDHMAASNSQVRRRLPRPLLPAFGEEADYWSPDLVYSTGTEGHLAYNTRPEKLLNEPEKFMEVYEKAYLLRQSELAYTLRNLPAFIKDMGVFLMGTSEGGMTVARFPDGPYGCLINGRIVSAWSCEYNYYVQSPEVARIGGGADRPMLNIIGDADHYFGAENSISSVFLQMAGQTGLDKHQPVTPIVGHGLKAMVEKGVEAGLVTFLLGGMHDPTLTHDITVRQILISFLERPHMCHRLPDMWRWRPRLRAQLQSERLETSEGGGKVLWVAVKPQNVADRRKDAFEKDPERLRGAVDEAAEAVSNFIARKTATASGDTVPEGGGDVELTEEDIEDESSRVEAMEIAINNAEGQIKLDMEEYK